MRFAFFSRTDAGVRLRILEGRRSRLQERLDRATSLHGEDDRYVSELRRHSIESVEREVRWLTELIEAERSSADRTGTRKQAAKPVRSAAATTTRAKARATTPAATRATPAPTPATPADTEIS